MFEYESRQDEEPSDLRQLSRAVLPIAFFGSRSLNLFLRPPTDEPGRWAWYAGLAGLMTVIQVCGLRNVRSGLVRSVVFGGGLLAIAAIELGAPVLRVSGFALLVLGGLSVPYVTRRDPVFK